MYICGNANVINYNWCSVNLFVNTLKLYETLFLYKVMIFLLLRFGFVMLMRTLAQGPHQCH